MEGDRRFPNLSSCPCRIHLELDFDTSCNRHIVDLLVGLQLGRTGYTNSGYPKGHAHDNSPQVPGRVEELGGDFQVACLVSCSCSR